MVRSSQRRQIGRSQRDFSMRRCSQRRITGVAPVSARAGGGPWVEWVRNVGQLGMRGGSGAERVRVGVYGAWERRNSKYGEV